MKRRGFLQMISAAVAAPLLPVPAPARAAPYSAAALHGAIYHAQSRAVFSVWGLSKTLGISPAAAEALMTDLSGRGVLGPLQGATPGGRWASSRILRREHLSVARAARRTPQRQTAQTIRHAPAEGADLTDLLAYLRRLAQREGHTLNPHFALA